MPPLPSVTDIKTEIGLIGSGDDALIATKIAAAIAMAEHDTGRVFSSSSNTTRRYSTNNESLLIIHDRPMTDASRVVTWSGATLTENADPLQATVWFLPDRRDPNIATSIQLKPFGVTDYRSEPFWFDRNLDRRHYGAGYPLDLSITGIIGHPFPSQDVVSNLIVATVFLYWRAKAGATGTAYNLQGDPISPEEMPPEYQR